MGDKELCSWDPCSGEAILLLSSLLQGQLFLQILEGCPLGNEWNTAPGILSSQPLPSGVFILTSVICFSNNKTNKSALPPHQAHLLLRHNWLDRPRRAGLERASQAVPGRPGRPANAGLEAERQSSVGKAMPSGQLSASLAGKA